MNCCYIPQKGVDDVIAEKLGGGYNTHRVATLRGMYDEAHKGEPLDTSDLNKAASTLATFRGQIKTNNRKQINSAGTNLVNNYRELKKVYSAEKRKWRVNLITSMFSAMVDRIQKANPHLTREQIIQGVNEGDGKTSYGEFYIFEQVYDALLNTQAKFAESKDKDALYKAGEVMTMLQNWSALCTHARVTLRDTEGVKLGNKMQESWDVDETTYGDNALEQMFDPTESVREAWQTSNGLESCFGKLGVLVRKMLSTIPVKELVSKKNSDGRVVQVFQNKRDDLGIVQYMDPITTHQTLSDLLRGMSNSNQMMTMLANSRIPWVKDIHKALEDNPKLRTQFYVDMKKNFMPYSVMIEDKAESSKGIKKFKTKVLNKMEDLLGGSFMARVLLGKPLNGDQSIFNDKGFIRNSRFIEVKKLIDDWLKPEGTAITAVSKFWSRGGSQQERMDFINEALTSVGVEIDPDTLISIFCNSKDLSKLVKAIKDLSEYGFNYKHFKERLGITDSIKYSEVIKFKNDSKQKESYFEESIRKIHTIITKHREGLRLENRVRCKNAKGDNISMYSQVNPSYLGDRINEIQAYVRNNDKDGLKRYLTDHFCNTEYFCYNGKILNKWLEELLNCCDTNSNVKLEDTFAGQFDYLRFLGTDDLSFENFNSKQQMLSMLVNYNSDREISAKADTALYPVFILGDSGVSKYIRAKRYKSEEILNGLYNVYQQEKRRQAEVRAVNQKLEEGGYAKVANFSESADRFTMLPFLNKDFAAEDGSVGKYAEMLSENPTESEIKAAVKAYMEDAHKTFKNKLEKLGLLETTEVTIEGGTKVQRYVYLGKEVTENNLDEKLADMYDNIKFATINQLQLFTIDSAFYEGTKDLQKRYKEMHAPGTCLDVEALDDNGKKYSEDGKESCVYFNDITTNTEETNPEFMEVMAKLYGKDSPIYKDYLKCSLTDGQGYRSLTGYRKVMGMAGKWSTTMEKAYNEILRIRETYSNQDIPAEELDRISELAVVFQPIKPFTFTHEVLPLNSDTKQVALIPVQHKYAEAVLIPELLPKNSKLRALGEYMEEKGIDIACSTKCVKVGCFGEVDISKVNNAEELAAALDKAYPHVLDYNDYREQTNVPEHIYKSSLFGTQSRKLTTSRVNMNENDYHYMDYIGGDGMVNLGGNTGKVKLNGRNLVALYNSLITAGILKSYDRFADIIKNPEKLSDNLIQGVINNNRESIDNLLAYSLDENGEFTIPLFEGGQEHDAAALLFSIFRKMVNKQQILGGSAVQVSAMGITGFNEDESLQCECSDDGENILSAQCEIPFDLSYTDLNGNKVELDFNEYCNTDGTLKMISTPEGEVSLLEQRFPGILDLVAYRIPTEQEYSMINLKIARFSPKTAGGTIKVPAQFTKIAGFDFDVDKLYFIRKEFKAREKYSHKGNRATISDIAPEELINAVDNLSFEEYDVNKPPYKNSRVAVNNMLLNIIRHRLMDPETLKKRTTPGGFKNASHAARIAREISFGETLPMNGDGSVNWEKLDRDVEEDDWKDPEPEYDPSDPMTMIIYNQQNQIAGKLIGIFANQNTNHAFASLMKKFQVSTPISFCGKSLNDLLNIPKDDYGNPIEDVDRNLAEMLAASVDAVKDPVLNYLNLNTITADAAGLLLRLGYNATEIGLLFNQPIIKEVCDICFDKGVKATTALGEVIKKYKDLGATLVDDVNKVDAETKFSKDKLAKNLSAARFNENIMGNSAFMNDQMEVLALMKQIFNVAGEVNSFVQATRFTAANSVGSTFGDFYAQQLKVNEYLTTIKKGKPALEIEVADGINAPINNSGELLYMSNEDYMDKMLNNPFMYEQAMYDSNRKCLDSLRKLFPYDTKLYTETRNFMNKLVNNGILDAATINSIHNDMLVYMLSNCGMTAFDPDRPYYSSFHGHTNNREFYTKYFAQDLLDFLSINPEMKEKPVFKYLIPSVSSVLNPKTGKKEDVVAVTIQGIGGQNSTIADEIRESWADLARNEDTRQIAEDLFLYNYYKLGFGFSPLSFMNLAPVEVKENLKVPTEDNREKTYADFLKDILKGNKISINKMSFAKQYILNHLDNYKFGLEAKTKTTKEIVKSLAMDKENNIHDSFVLDLGKLDNNVQRFFCKVNAQTKMKMFTPVIKINTGVGKLTYVADYFDETGGMTMTYRRVDSLGAKGQSLQYDGDHSSLNVMTVYNDNTENLYGDGNSNQDPGVIHDEIISREDMINEVVEALAAAYDKAGLTNLQGERITADALRQEFSEKSTDTLEAWVKTVRAACKDGQKVLTLDANGNMTMLC